MHHLACFYASVTNGSSYAAVAGAVDSGLTLLPSSYYLSGKKLRVLAAAGLQTNLTALQIDAPSLRNLGLPEVYPGIAAAAVPDRYAIANYSVNGPSIQPNEGFIMRMSAGGAAAADGFGAMWVTAGFRNAQQGPVTTVPCTATITCVKGAWVMGALTPATTLQAGNWEIVGMELVASNTWAGRLVLPGNDIGVRPGVLAVTAYGRVPQEQYARYGRFGSFGSFNANQLPALELFGLAAGAASPVAYLDLVKTG